MDIFPIPFTDERQAGQGHLKHR